MGSRAEGSITRNSVPYRLFKCVTWEPTWGTTDFLKGMFGQLKALSPKRVGRAKQVFGSHVPLVLRSKLALVISVWRWCLAVSEQAADLAKVSNIPRGCDLSVGKLRMTQQLGTAASRHHPLVLMILLHSWGHSCAQFVNVNGAVQLLFTAAEVRSALLDFSTFSVTLARKTVNTLSRSGQNELHTLGSVKGYLQSQWRP